MHVHLSFSLLPTARVCDNVLLRCQNGGVCHHHQRCQCPAGFGGILCEKPQCQSDSCEDLQSSQPSLRPPPTAQTLPLALLSLIPSLLATWGLTSLWGERFHPKDILHRGSNHDFLLEDTQRLKINASFDEKKNKKHIFRKPSRFLLRTMSIKVCQRWWINWKKLEAARGNLQRRTT